MTAPAYESMPEVVCTRCQQPVEAFSVLDDDNRSATWWEHVVEPLDDHDVTFEEQPPNDTSFDPRGYGTRLIAPDASAPASPSAAPVPGGAPDA